MAGSKKTPATPGAADEFTRILLPFQDTSLGDDPAADTEPSVLEKILDPSS